MTDLEKLRAEFWCVAAMKATDLCGIAESGDYADAMLTEFDKRFKSTPCSHLFFAPSTNCAKCGEPMSQAMAEYLKRNPAGIDT